MGSDLAWKRGLEALSREFERLSSDPVLRHILVARRREDSGDVIIPAEIQMLQAVDKARWNVVRSRFGGPCLMLHHSSETWFDERKVKFGLQSYAKVDRNWQPGVDELTRQDAAAPAWRSVYELAKRAGGFTSRNLEPPHFTGLRSPANWFLICHALRGGGRRLHFRHKCLMPANGPVSESLKRPFEERWTSCTYCFPFDRSDFTVGEIRHDCAANVCGRAVSNEEAIEALVELTLGLPPQCYDPQVADGEILHFHGWHSFVDDIRLESILTIAELTADAGVPRWAGVKSNLESLADNRACLIADDKIRVGEETILLEFGESGVLVPLIVAGGAASLSGLQKLSGKTKPQLYLKQLLKREPRLGNVIKLPGGKGRGGYQTTIQDTRGNGQQKQQSDQQISTI